MSIADPQELRQELQCTLATVTSATAIPAAVLDTGDEQGLGGASAARGLGRPLGALVVSFRTPRTILEEERVSPEALALQRALAVERAEMYEKEDTAAGGCRFSAVCSWTSCRACAAWSSTRSTCRGPTAARQRLDRRFRLRDRAGWW